MRRCELSPERLEFLKKAAVSAVMKLGRFESSGPVRLLILRRKDVMIAYRTPFNPLPPLSEQAKYLAALDGKTSHLLPYGLDIWQLDVGRVMSLGWRDGGAVIADLYRPGEWERFLGAPRNSRGQFIPAVRARKSASGRRQ